MGSITTLPLPRYLTVKEKEKKNFLGNASPVLGVKQKRG